MNNMLETTVKDGSKEMFRIKDIQYIERMLFFNIEKLKSLPESQSQSKEAAKLRAEIETLQHRYCTNRI